MIELRCAICGKPFKWKYDEHGECEYTEGITIIMWGVEETWHHQKCYEDYVRYDEEV